jgi:uncharacterized protein involved in propanediol utilization
LSCLCSFRGKIPSVTRCVIHCGRGKETSQPEKLLNHRKSTAEQQEHGKIINNFKILITIFAIQMFLFFLRSFGVAEKGLAAGKSGVTMMKKHNEILALMCNTELMGIWRSNQGSVIYEYFSAKTAENKRQKQRK